LGKNLSTSELWSNRDFGEFVKVFGNESRRKLPFIIFI
jgi:hypothetical protein